MTASGFAVTPELERDLERVRRPALAVGLVVLALCFLGAYFWPADFSEAYLAAYLFWIGLALGCMAILMLQYLSGGSWGVVILRMLEAATRTFPLLAALFIPLLIAIPYLAPWAHSNLVANDPILRHKSFYLNTPFFVVRVVLYFAIWLTLAHFLNKWSAEQDTSRATRLSILLQRISAPGLILYAATVSLASVDWAMSLAPHWYSTMFGFLQIAGQGLNSLSFIIAVTIFLFSRPPLAGAINRTHLHDLGKLLLMFVMLWAYFAFSQLLIIWSGNLRNEIPWYYERMYTSWGWVGIAIVLFHFFVPFFLLLSRDLKRNARAMLIVAGILLFMRYVDLYWTVTPERYRSGIHVDWMNILAPIGMGGVWLAVFLSQLKKRALIPIGDPRLEEALAHGRSNTERP